MSRPTTVTDVAPVGLTFVLATLLKSMLLTVIAFKIDPGTIAVVMTTPPPESLPPPPDSLPSIPVVESHTDISPAVPPARTVGHPAMFTATRVTLVAPVVGTLTGDTDTNFAALYESSTCAVPTPIATVVRAVMDTEAPAPPLHCTDDDDCHADASDDVKPTLACGLVGRMPMLEPTMVT
jgi:hypothetical protein